MMWSAKQGTQVLAAVLLFAAGLTTGWILWHPRQQKVETYAREVRQEDGSLILERKPQADVKPAQQIPAGAKVERVVQVTVQPRTPGASTEARAGTSGSAPEAAVAPAGATSPETLQPVTPAPVRVDLTLLRMPDQTRRVVASSPDGQVVGGVDIPVDTAQPQKTLKWAAGAVFGRTSTGDRSTGAFLDRDMAFLRLGAEVSRVTPTATPSPGTYWDARVKVGLRF